jgi:hypothetical protein
MSAKQIAFNNHSVINGTAQSIRFMGAGTFTLNGASPAVATVADTRVDANTVVDFCVKTAGGTPGATRVSALTPSTSFVVTGANGDTSIYNYVLWSYI